MQAKWAKIIVVHPLQRTVNYVPWGVLPSNCVLGQGGKNDCVLGV